LDASQGALGTHRLDGVRIREHMRARTLIFVVLLLSCGAVGARQPAVRMAVPLPVPAEQIAEAAGLATVDRSTFVLNLIRTLFGTGLREGDQRQRLAIRQLIEAPGSPRGVTVPLPLDASIWRETLLQRPVPDDQIIAAIVMERNTALLYHGLSGLDDATLAWLGPERETLQYLLRRAGAFSVFGPSLRVQAGKIVVPGGEDTQDLWRAVVGADPRRPAAFIRKLFDEESGHLAWFYDSMSQLDEPRLRFALGLSLPPESRVERARALLDVFIDGGSEWTPESQPFSRRPLDPLLSLLVIDVAADGTLVGPSQRDFWERLFEDGGKWRPANRPRGIPESTAAVDAAWLLGRIHRAPIDVGRRRLEMFLFGQRMLPPVSVVDSSATTVVSAYAAFPSLMLTLERMGVRSAATIIAGATRANALNEIHDDKRRRVALLQLQASIGILERMTRAGTLSATRVDALCRTLFQIESSSRGYDGKLAIWIREELLPDLPRVDDETSDALEDTLLAAMAGVRPASSSSVVEWEGRHYQVNPGEAEARRLRRIRERQGGLSLGRALAGVDEGRDEKAGLVLAETLTSILYATHLGDPEGPAVATGNIAQKHELGTFGGVGTSAAWKLPAEHHTSGGWRVSGSLLGLDVALARMALRRLDATVLPPEPRLVSAERQTAALSVALANPTTLTNASRDEIAAALDRGRARLTALDGSRTTIEMVSRDAGLSPWRREALAWTLAHDRENLPGKLSLLETMWLGKPRTAAGSLDGWGAAVLPLNGCVCLAMPRAKPWELLAGRPALGLLATQGADVAILVADTLAALQMPAAIAPGVIAYTMQEVVDRAQPANFDDWLEFSRATMAVSRDTLVDYIAAQTAGGSLRLTRNAGRPDP
jgi:hypothetical protein